MNKDIAILSNAFQESRFIKNCVQQFSGFDLFHVVISANKSWNGNLKQDDTPYLAHKYGANLVIEGDFKTEAQQFNYGLSQLRSFKYVWIVDADERYLQADIKSILEIANNSNYDIIKTYNMDVYWKTREYKIIPAQNDCPNIVVKPTVNFVKARSCQSDNIGWIATRMHHLSYVRSDEEMLKKISTFSHSDEFDLQNWYQNKWLKWTPDALNLHPVNSPQFRQAIYNPLPLEIQE